MPLMKINALDSINSAIDDLNAQSDREIPIGKAPETRLFGTNGIDSLDLVNLIVGIEQYIEEEMGEVVVLVDEDSMSAQENPFETVGSLAAYIGGILAKKQ
jgi:acyl carrier protein